LVEPAAQRRSDRLRLVLAVVVVDTRQQLVLLQLVVLVVAVCSVQ
jgi:hypothetical protein